MALAALALVATVLATSRGESASAADGGLDESFGTYGVVRRNVGGDFVTTDEGNAIIHQPDGKVLMAGGGSKPDSNFVLMRVLADGAPDPSFGVDGVSDHSFSTGFDAATALALQPDGKILAGGYITRPSGIRAPFALVRYLSNGAVDASFGVGGVVTNINIDGWPAGAVRDVTVQSDGKIVVLAQTDVLGAASADLFRFTTTGALDPTFGNAGNVRLASRTDTAMARQSGDRVVVVGSALSAPYRMLATRLSADGAIDPSFGGAGTGTGLYGAHANDGASAVVVGPDDRITIGGQGGDGVGQLTFARLTPDGALDPSFGTAGYVSTTITTSYEHVHDLALQADGKLVVVGGYYGNAAYRWFVTRYSPGGLVDASFMGNGFVPLESGAALAVAIGTDGFFVTGAQGTSGDFVIYKFGIGTPSPPVPSTSVPTTITGPAPTTTVAAPPPAGSRYASIPATRVLDTRSSGPSGRVAARGQVDAVVTGEGRVPADATAVVVNVTATDADAPGYVTVWPAGTLRPDVSSLNVGRAGGTVANLVTVPLASSGAVSLFSEAGTHLVVDLVGYYARVDAPVREGRFRPLAPVRALDTRALGADAPAVVDLDVRSVPGLPTVGVSAIVANLTATGSTRAGFVTLWPRAAGAQPGTSNLNLDAAQQTRANQVIVAVGDGTIRLATASGAHLIVDIVGYMTDDAAPVASSGLFVPFTPTRVLDTRAGVGVRAGLVHAGEQIDAFRTTIPVTNPLAVVGNLTATQSTAPGFVTMWATADGRRPDVSTINLDESDQTRANQVTATVGADGRLSFFAEAGAHLVLDLAGAFVR